MLTLNNLSWLIRTIDSYSVSGYQRLVLSYTIPYIHIRSYGILFMHGDTRRVLVSAMTKHVCNKGGHGTHLVKHLYLTKYILETILECL